MHYRFYQFGKRFSSETFKDPELGAGIDEYVLRREAINVLFSLRGGMLLHLVPSYKRCVYVLHVCLVRHQGLRVPLTGLSPCYTLTFALESRHTWIGKPLDPWLD